MANYKEPAQATENPSDFPVNAGRSSVNVKDQNSAEKQLKKLIAYARVSTKQQGEGDSPYVQETRIRSFVSQQGATLHAYHDEVASGRHGYGERPEFHQAILSARSLGYPIICTAVDRLGRDEAFLTKEIIEAGIRVISVDHGRELEPGELRSLARKAESDAKRIARGTERSLRSTRGGASAGASKGGRQSGAARSERASTYNATVAGKIEEIEARHGRSLGFSELARELDVAGVQTPRGGRQWHPMTVKRVLKDSVRFIFETLSAD